MASQSAVLANDGNAGTPPQKAMGGKRALVVGINNYASPNQLPSCVNDAQTFATLLKSNFGFSDITVLTDAQASKANLTDKSFRALRHRIGWFFSFQVMAIGRSRTT